MKLSEHNEVVMEKFANMFIERLKAVKASDWKQGWCGKVVGQPVNLEGRQYSGGNSMMLMLDASLRNFQYPIYCTLHQANRLGAHINKGAKSMPVIFWDLMAIAPDGKKVKAETLQSLTPQDRLKYRTYPVLKSFNVFNIAETNLEEKAPEKVDAAKQQFIPTVSKDDSGMYKCEALDRMMKDQTWVCRIQNDRPAEGAFYSPARDIVIVPMKEQFKIHDSAEEIYKDGQEFYSSLLHEMVHSTGTANRLNRPKGTRFGDDAYAREELVAEVTAARVGQVLGFDKRILDNNACYCDGWINALREKPEFILQLMGDVDKASRMILEKM